MPDLRPHQRWTSAERAHAISVMRRSLVADGHSVDGPSAARALELALDTLGQPKRLSRFDESWTDRDEQLAQVDALVDGGDAA